MKRIKLISWGRLRNTLIFAGIGVFILMSCGHDDEAGTISYDPTHPVVLNSFYPDSGKYQEQVILMGENFGTDPENISVYFNTAKAAVIGADGDRIYVQAPRLPGDTCTISVAIGNDSVAYEHTFLYSESVTVTTIAGNGNSDDYQDGDLSSSILQPRYLCVDNENNIFVMCRNANDTQFEMARIDEEDNELITLQKGGANVPCADPETGMITIPTETTIGSFYTLNPKELWAPRFREMKWPKTGQNLPDNGWKHSMVVNPEDGSVYTRYYYGQIVKLNPKTYEVEVIYTTGEGNSYGLTFNPLHPNILYLSFASGVYANCIYTIDVTDPENTFQKIAGVTSGGHRDGPLDVAQFREPEQIFCDDDGNIYVADSNNHCIRRITPDNMVETVLGMPGTAGWKDGTKDEALFNHPRGIGIGKDGSVYVADFGNSRVRKLSIN